MQHIVLVFNIYLTLTGESDFIRLNNPNKVGCLH